MPIDSCNIDLRYVVEFKVEVQVTLRLTVGQSVIMSWCGQILVFPFLLQENCFAVRLGAPSLMRGRVCTL
jgi:hypothetical protein